MESFTVIGKKNPFISYTARPDREPPVDILHPKMSVLESLEMNIQEVITTREPRIVPVLGSAGAGKTSLFWSIKRLSSENTFVVYLSPQTTEQHAEKLYTSLWFAWLEQHGLQFLKDLGQELMQKFGSLDNLIAKLPGLTAVVAEALFAFSDEDNPQIQQTARYLFSGIQTNNPILPNKTQSFLEDDELCFVALKLVLKFVKKPVIFYFDEIESLFVNYGELKMEPEIRLLEKIKRFYNECENLLIVLSSLPEIWQRIIKLSTVSAVSRFESPAVLKRLSKDDLYELVEEYMENYWQESSLTGINFPSNIWPFTEDELNHVLEVTEGNPRESIKNLRVLWNQHNEFITKFLASKLG